MFYVFFLPMNNNERNSLPDDIVSLKSVDSFKSQLVFTVPVNNMRPLKFKAQPSNAFFATVNQMFRNSYQLPTTAKHVVSNQIIEHSSVNKV